MIRYLATTAIGEFGVQTTSRDGRPTVIAIDSDLPPGRPRRRRLTHRRDHRLHGRLLWPLPVRGQRRGPRRHPRPRVRAGEPDPLGPRAAQLRRGSRPTWWRTRWPTSGSATASGCGISTTSGSTRPSPRKRRTSCGVSTAPKAPLWRSSTSYTPCRWKPPPGRRRRATRARPTSTCWATWSTTGAR